MDEENQNESLEIISENFYNIISYSTVKISTFKKEFQCRLNLYKSDFKIKKYGKVLAAIFFMFATHISDAITFSQWLMTNTNNWIGPIEVLLSNSITGILFSLIGGQPLIILGVTGPVSIYTITMYQISQSLNLNFLAFYGFTGLLAGLMHIVLAITNSCNFVKYVTKFSCEVFGTLIGIIYTINGIEILINILLNKSSNVFLFSFVLGMCVYIFNGTLKKISESRFFNDTLRNFISDYSVFISLIIGISLQFIFPSINLERMNVGSGEFIPSICSNSSIGCRNWIVNIFNLPVWGFFLAIIPAFILTVLFFFDHNVSSLLAQQGKFNLKKPPAYNYDFFIVGILIILCSIFGLPPVNGLIPHAPLHVKSLATIRYEINQYGEKDEIWEEVEEQRVSNLCKSILMGLMCIPFLLKYFIGYIPIACLSGIFIIIGMSTFNSELIDRILLFFEDPTKIKQNKYITGDLDNNIEPVSNNKIKIFTYIQIFFVILIYALTRTPAAIAFPLFIAILIPIRLKLLPLVFKETELELLDSSS